MKFKTKIEIITDAHNKNDAMEIVDEFLSGYFSHGVEMRCSTRPIHNRVKPVVGCIVLSLIIPLSVLSLARLKPYKNCNKDAFAISAIQMPLKTSFAPDATHFKKDWQSKEILKALNIIKK